MTNEEKQVSSVPDPKASHVPEPPRMNESDHVCFGDTCTECDGDGNAKGNCSQCGNPLSKTEPLPKSERSFCSIVCAAYDRAIRGALTGLEQSYGRYARLPDTEPPAPPSACCCGASFATNRRVSRRVNGELQSMCGECLARVEQSTYPSHPLAIAHANQRPAAREAEPEPDHDGWNAWSTPSYESDI